MAFHDIRFPVDIAYGSTGGPEFSTEVIETHGGYEQRNSNWADARGRYNVAHGVKTTDQLDALIAFFRARKGRAHSFRFKDWADWRVSAQVLGLGDGSKTSFQLLKTYSSGGAVITRSITKPVAGSVMIYVDEVAQAGSVSMDAATGVVTFDAAPTEGAVITADFEFDVTARFDTDRLEASFDSYGSHSWRDVPIIEVR